MPHKIRVGKELIVLATCIKPAFLIADDESDLDNNKESANAPKNHQN